MLLAAPQLEPWGRISTSAVWPGATHGVRKTTGTAQWTSAAAPPPVVATGSCCDPAATVAPSAVLKFSSPIAVFVLALSSRELPPVAQALAFEELQLAGETLRPLAQPLASSSCYRFEIVGTRTPSMKRRVFTFLFCFLCFSHVAFMGSTWIQESTDRRNAMAWLRTLLVAAAVAVAAAEKGDLYGKDGKEKNSLVEQVPLSRGAESSGRAERGTA